ncbi:MAG: hypothetical protein E7105_12455 [Prevotella sp.]|nr:hypothetical protein [Prevotella sp.]
MEIRRKESCKDEKAALKFGGIAEKVFLCGVKTSVLATPLSAGSKTLSPLLHLKATFQGRLLFFISLSEDAVEIWITRWECCIFAVQKQMKKSEK